MKKSQLEILSIDNIVENRDKLKDYDRMYEWRTPHIKVPKKENKLYKFHNEMNEIIIDKGKEINADLAVIESTNTWYPNSTANHNVVFYKKKE